MHLLQKGLQEGQIQQLDFLTRLNTNKIGWGTPKEDLNVIIFAELTNIISQVKKRKGYLKFEDIRSKT